MSVLIKRYANRKLYNTKTSRYITLKGIAELIETGDDVRVIDNETGEDITHVALSQILVDHERSNSAASRTLLSEMISRGGDALYGALRRGVGDASDGIGELQNNLRRIVKNREHDASKLGEWIAVATPDFDRVVQGAMERVFKVLDLPRRGDIEALNANLQRVAEAVESLQHAEPRKSAASGKSDVKPDGKPGAKSGSRSSGKPGDEPGSKSSGRPGDEPGGRSGDEPGDGIR
ncbi:MAG: polyhydroxyalkanoate synthesis regulator DNA-binding domain-containing protein [Myxococcota bacterium]